MKENIILDKSYAFSIRIVKMYRYLVQNENEFVLSKQVLRSGTQIGVNVEEAIGGQSPKDFISKLAIAYKEARETHYWIRLLRDCDFLKEKLANSMLEDCDELLKIIGTIIKTMRNKNS